jgi:hypothetical protein
MSSALVPGWMRRFALASSIVNSICEACLLAAAPPDGDLGPIWSSAGGGGLGSRGELGGIDISSRCSVRFDYRLVFSNPGGFREE